MSLSLSLSVCVCHSQTYRSHAEIACLLRHAHVARDTVLSSALYSHIHTDHHLIRISSVYAHSHIHPSTPNNNNNIAIIIIVFVVVVVVVMLVVPYQSLSFRPSLLLKHSKSKTRPLNSLIEHRHCHCDAQTPSPSAFTDPQTQRQSEVFSLEQQRRRHRPMASAAGLVVLGLPQASVMSMDCGEAMRTGAMFQGLHGIQTGVHVLCVAPKEEGGSAERSIVFFNVETNTNKIDDGDDEEMEMDEEEDGGEKICLVLRWDEAEERLVNVIQAAQSGDGERSLREQYQRGVQRGELNGMGPCRRNEDEEARWKMLTRHVDEKLLRSIGIEFGDVLSTCDEPAPFVLNVDKKKKKHAMRGANTDQRADQQQQEEQTLERTKREKSKYTFTRIIGSGPHHDIRRPHASMTPEEVTKHNMDGSEYLASLVASSSSSSSPRGMSKTRLLGEMAISFLLFITVMSAEGFRHWKSIVALVCACAPNAGGASLDVFRGFVELLMAQMQVVDESFFDEAELALGDGARGRDVHFFSRSLSRLVYNVEDMACDAENHGTDDARVLFRCVSRLKKLMKDKFGIALETTYCGGEEYEPTIVVTDEDTLQSEILDAVCTDAPGDNVPLPQASCAQDLDPENIDAAGAGGNDEKPERMSWMLPQSC